MPALAQAQVAALASDAGFEVRRVEVTGVNRMNELKVYERFSELGEEGRMLASLLLRLGRGRLG